MKNHVWRPLFLVLLVIALILSVRAVLVPDDFGISERGYMYGWHRASNEAEWKGVRIKYATSRTCPECHPRQSRDLGESAHRIIACENCHGPAYDHPRDPVGLSIDRTRGLCLRCHAKLPYRNARSKIPGIDPDAHHPEATCIMCHYPHNPTKPSPKQKESEVRQ